jgi:AcrR family transcriptional regulator
MKNKSEETQELILTAAKSVFAQKGYAGARMQEIADEAGINKALLHYYYRSKEKLFEQVFEEAVQKLLRPVGVFLADDSALFQKIRNLCHHYYSVLLELPFIPNFVINELSLDPERIIKILQTVGVSEGKETTIHQIERSIRQGEIRDIDPSELIWNIMCLCVFPFLSKPIASNILYKGEDVDQVLMNRADRVADFIIESIRI